VTGTERAEPARLIVASAPARPRGVVLVLHGGRERSMGRVQPWQMAALRLLPVAREVVRQAHRTAVVARLLFRVRGWNSPDLPAIADAEWALRECRRRFGARLPIALIGHSMGGRVALRAGGDPDVAGVVALAPWLPPGEPREQLRGRRVLLVHGTADRITDPRASEAFAAALAGIARSAAFVRVPAEGHALLRRRGAVDALAAAFSLHAVGLGNDNAGGPDVLEQALAGADRLTL
jgi:predicted esterase